ncbi:hypothetical protein D3C86_1988330 [compost metagenome]
MLLYLLSGQKVSNFITYSDEKVAHQVFLWQSLLPLCPKRIENIGNNVLCILAFAEFVVGMAVKQLVVPAEYFQISMPIVLRQQINEFRIRTSAVVNFHWLFLIKLKK